MRTIKILLDIDYKIYVKCLNEGVKKWFILRNYQNDDSYLEKHLKRTLKYVYIIVEIKH